VPGKLGIIGGVVEQVTPVGSHHFKVVPVGVTVTKDFILVGLELLPAT
jgi:hypothetical protein